MNIGPLIYTGWFAILIASEVIADAHITRRGSRGCIAGFLGIIGAFLSWAFISAYSRAAEIPDYMQSESFALLLGIGCTGIILFLASCFILGSTTRFAGNRGAA